MSSTFDKKSYKKLNQYIQECKSATYIAGNVLAKTAWYHIHGGKGPLGQSEPLLVIARPKKYDFRVNRETGDITVRIPIKVNNNTEKATTISREDQQKIQLIRNSMLDTALEDRLGLTLGGDRYSQGLFILARAGAYTIEERDKVYVIELRLEDDQNPMGARLVPRGGPYAPNSTGSTRETTSSKDRGDLGQLRFGTTGSGSKTCNPQ